MAEQIERWNCYPEAARLWFQSPPWPLAGFVLDNPELNSSVTLLISQPICLRLAGILNPVETTGLPVIVLPIESLLFLELIKKTLTSNGTLQFSRQI